MPIQRKKRVCSVWLISISLLKFCLVEKRPFLNHNLEALLKKTEKRRDKQRPIHGYSYKIKQCSQMENTFIVIVEAF